MLADSARRVGAASVATPCRRRSRSATYSSARSRSAVSMGLVSYIRASECSGAVQRGLCDLEGAHGVVAGLGLPQTLDVEGVEGPFDLLEEADRQVRRLDAVLAEGELVELPDALPVVAPQGVEELEQFDRVYGSGDHVVVPAAQVVVDVHAEQAAVVDGQLRRVRR